MQNRASDEHGREIPKQKGGGIAEQMQARKTLVPRVSQKEENTEGRSEAHERL